MPQGYAVTPIRDHHPHGFPKRRIAYSFSEARFKHVFKLMGLLFGKKMEREGKKAQDETLTRMKALIEEGATA